MFNSIIAFLTAAVRQGIPLMFGATGEILTEKSGHLNLGIPGIMYMGGISGVIGAYLYENSTPHPNTVLLLLIPLLSCLLGAGLLSLIYCFLTVTLKSNQNVTGLAITTLGVGIDSFFGGSLAKLAGNDGGSISFDATKNVYKANFPFMRHVGDFANTGFLLYVAIIVVVLSSLFLTKTRRGLNLRAVGENPATADAAGINVTLYRYTATCIGGMLAGLGGLYFYIDYIFGWTSNGFGDRGWLAVAIVIFSLWRPHNAAWTSVLFGGLYIACGVTISGMSHAQKELMNALPYVVTIIILVVTSARKKRENQPPEALGTNYFREDR